MPRADVFVAHVAHAERAVVEPRQRRVHVGEQIAQIGPVAVPRGAREQMAALDQFGAEIRLGGGDHDVPFFRMAICPAW